MWDYDDDRKTQRLERLVALCPACHEVKHAGLASKRGPSSAVIAHLAEVCLEAVFETWVVRSGHQWTLDISLLSTRYGMDRADRTGREPGSIRASTALAKRRPR